MNLGKALLAGSLTVLISACASNFNNDNNTEVDTHFSGAYQFEDGTLVTLGPSNEERMRMLRYKDGQPFSLYHDEGKTFKASKGFSSKDFFANGQLEYNVNGDVTGARWEENGEVKSVTKLPLIRKSVYFKSGELTLRGELTLPAGKGPFPVVITVHGSEDYSAVDYYHWPYILAAHGIAGFKFDKRGTGGSEGEYTQHFPTLAGDVIAAISALEKDNAIDPSRVNLIGFSQGGWIAPLVAKQTDIQSYIVGFGTSVPVPREDRWGYVKQLIDNGYGEQEIAFADEFNEQLNKIIYQHDEDAWEGLFQLKEQHEDSAWFKTISGSDSMLGFVAEKITHPLANLVPEFGWKLYTRWKKGGNESGPGFNRTYQPLETLSQLQTPSMWLLSGEDSSLPTPETVDELKLLQSQGSPIDYRVYPGAEHGNINFVVDEQGNRTYTGYVPTYFSDVVDYFKKQNRI